MVLLAVARAAQKLEDVPLYIDDTPGLTIAALRARARRMKKKHEIGLIIIDYLDELRATQHYQDKRMESRDITGDVRRLGAEFSCPVWTASQGNRASMKKQNVGMDDVAEDIWKVNQAHVVITLNQTEEEEEENVIRYKVLKARRENHQPRTIMLGISPAGRIREVEGV